MQQQQKKHFNPLEHLIADLAFSPADSIVPSHEKPKSYELNDEETLFNDELKKPRSRSEHCIGVLKGRFPFLKSIRFLLTEDKEITRKNLNHINVCTILHNFPLIEKDERTEFFCEEDGCASDVDANNELNRPVGTSQMLCGKIIVISACSM